MSLRLNPDGSFAIDERTRHSALAAGSSALEQTAQGRAILDLVRTAGRDGDAVDPRLRGLIDKMASYSDGLVRVRGSRAEGKVYIMFHGTDLAAALAIERDGFRQSASGMLGPGVYLSRDIEKAKAYGSTVLRVRVCVGRVKQIDRQGHPQQKSWHEAGYDTAWVPPRCGMVGSGLEEDCVYDPSRIKVIDRASTDFT